MKKKCAARTKNGRPCSRFAKPDLKVCGNHAKPNTERPLVRAKLSILCRVLAKTGNITEACKHADIERSTYYTWAKEGTEEYAAIIDAWNQFAAIDDAEIEAEFRARLLDSIRGSTETWVTEEFVIDDNGKEVGKRITKRTVTRGPAKWALDIAAIQVAGGRFTRANTAVAKDGQSENDKPLTDNEAAQQICSILGIQLGDE